MACDIHNTSGECMTLRRNEAAWNATVHQPLLKLAFSRQRPSAVLFENATVAGASLEERIYKLLAAFRLIGGWVDTTFRSWAVDTFGSAADLG